MKRPAYPKYKPSRIEWLGDNVLNRFKRQCERRFETLRQHGTDPGTPPSRASLRPSPPR